MSTSSDSDGINAVTLLLIGIVGSVYFLWRPVTPTRATSITTNAPAIVQQPKPQASETEPEVRLIKVHVVKGRPSEAIRTITEENGREVVWRHQWRTPLNCDVDVIYDGKRVLHLKGFGEGGGDTAPDQTCYTMAFQIPDYEERFQEIDIPVTITRVKSTR